MDVSPANGRGGLYRGDAARFASGSATTFDLHEGGSDCGSGLERSPSGEGLAGVRTTVRMVDRCTRGRNLPHADCRPSTRFAGTRGKLSTASSLRGPRT